MRFGIAFVMVALMSVSTGTVAASERPLPPDHRSVPSPTGCVVGPGLGATLLFPYFEVDLEDTGGLATLISINNGLDSPGLARVILWTDWGVPTLAFDIYLGAFDLQTINLKSIFDGSVPSTGESAVLSDFPFCTIVPPYHDNPAISTERIEQLRAAHTGRPGPIDSLCYGADHGDSIARGYITVDSVSLCGGLESFDPQNTPVNSFINYFDNDRPGAMANDRNLLWGDVFFLDDRNNAAQGTGAVSLWANSVLFGDSNIYTFYGRFKGWAGYDDRVPIPGEWAQRFLNGGPFEGGAELIVFRHPNHTSSSAVACGNPPAWFPLQSTVTTSDEDGGQVVHHQTDLFGLLTQRVSIGEFEPAPSVPFGLVRISGDEDQLWVQPVLTGLGRFGVGLEGVPVQTLCNQIPPSALR